MYLTLRIRMLFFTKLTGDINQVFIKKINLMLTSGFIQGCGTARKIERWHTAHYMGPTQNLFLKK